MGCGRGTGDEGLTHDEVRAINERVLERAIDQPDSALMMIEGLRDTLPDYRCDYLRAKVYAQSLEGMWLDSAIIIGERLMMTDAASEDLAYRQDVLEMLINASTQTLTLDFTTAESIVKGTPYLVKADVDGPTFEGVSQDWTAYNEVTPATNGGYATFVPVLTPTTLYANDKTKLYLGGNNTLYYPSGDVNVNGFRAYFKLNNDLTAGDLPNTARAFVLNIDGDQTGIRSLTPDASPKGEGSIYSLDGRKVQNTTRKGIYIVNGKKVVIK